MFGVNVRHRSCRRTEDDGDGLLGDIGYMQTHGQREATAVMPRRTDSSDRAAAGAELVLEEDARGRLGVPGQPPQTVLSPHVWLPEAP